MEKDEIEKLAALEGSHWWYRERRAVLAKLLKNLGPTGKALDIGAACGGNTQVLRDNGWDAFALDYSETGPAICRRRGLPAVQADATQLPIGEDSLDLVVAFDVLEHIEDDAAVVREVRRVLRPGGKFVVAVPADPELWSAHDEAVLHCRRYTPEALRSVVLGERFEIGSMWNWNVLMRPALKMRRHNVSGSDLDMVPPALNALLTRIIQLERYLPLSGFAGTSLFLEAAALPTFDLVGGEGLAEGYPRPHVEKVAV